MICRTLFTDSSPVAIFDLGNFFNNITLPVQVIHNESGVVSEPIKKITNFLLKMVYTSRDTPIYILTSGNCKNAVNGYLKKIRVNSNKVKVINFNPNNTRIKLEYISNILDKHTKLDIYLLNSYVDLSVYGKIRDNRVNYVPCS